MSDHIHGGIQPPHPEERSADSPGTEGVPACSLCGRQDETLRIVAYPFVYSVVLATFRRAYAGLWCRRHRNQRLALASLITATVGWLGIPFGFIRTPTTLFRLAQGGVQSPHRNAHMLRTLAEHKLRTGDPEGAVRCLEAAFQFSDDEPSKERLRQVHVELALPSYRSGCLGLLLTPLAVLLGASLVGATIGILDSMITALSSILLSGSGSIYGLTLSWTPFLAMLFIGGLAVCQLAEWGLARLRSQRIVLGLLLGVLTTIAAISSVSYGSAISQVAVQLLFGGAYPSWVHAIAVAVEWAPVSLLFNMFPVLGETNAGDIIYALLLWCGAAYYLTMTALATVRTARWQRRLSLIYAQDPTQAARTQPHPVARREVALGCVGALALLCQVMALLGGTLSFVSYHGAVSSRTSLQVSVSCPAEVRRGEAFQAVLHLHNVEDEPLTITEIDVDSSLEFTFMDGVEVQSSSPPFEHHYVDDGHYWFTGFSLAIQPGHREAITLELKAVEPGHFRGSVFVDVVTGDDTPLHTSGTGIEVAVLP